MNQNRIRDLRVGEGLTLDQLALDVGIKRGTLNNYENGKTEPKLEIWAKLAFFFGVSPAYLVGWDDSKDSENKGPWEREYEW